VARKKKLKFGFHYTWKEILPKSEVIVVCATDLEEARTIVRAKVRKKYPDVSPGCHWITMPQDFDHKPPRGPLAETAQKVAYRSFWRTPLLISLRGIVVVGLIALLIILLSGCSLERCNTSLRRFNKNLTQWQVERFGIKVYKLESIPRETPYRLPPTRPSAVPAQDLSEPPWESPVFFHP